MENEFFDLEESSVINRLAHGLQGITLASYISQDYLERVNSLDQEKEKEITIATLAYQ